MGFLLQNPGSLTTASSDEGVGHDGESGAALSSPPRRELRIPCTHRVMVERLDSPVPQLQRWPYARKMTLDGLTAQLLQFRLEHAL